LDEQRDLAATRDVGSPDVGARPGPQRRRKNGRSMTIIDDIKYAEVALDELASQVPSPNAATGAGGVIGGLFASRTRDTYVGFVHAVSGPSLVAPAILVRPLIEGAILVRWMEDEPEARYGLWRAHSEEMDGKAIRQLEERRPRPAGDPFDKAALAPVLASKDGIVAATRTASGRETAPRVLPDLAQMADAVIKKHPDERDALNQAYQLGFRGVSGSTHNDAQSFKTSLVEQPDGSMRFTPAAPVDLLLVRLIACACVAYTIESCARLVGNGDLERAALAIRLGLATA
jgi:hypothetical protein